MKKVKISYVRRDKIESVEFNILSDIRGHVAREVYRKPSIPQGGVRVDVTDTKARTSFSFVFFKRSSK